MTYIINESKRDDLLIPYLQKIQAQYPELTLGKFKGMMLDKLAAQGGLNNLSLSSNYYLAGATRYYFNGDLTLDHQAHFGTADDKWNTEVCQRLNALIMILRDAYIDTIGTAFEQPEDFGTLSLPKLLRKYNKKINSVLGIEDTTKSKEKAAPTLDENPRVGNGYTFDILYSYEQATKYNVYTSPGAWCITYAQHHFNHYVRALGIHYVIFLKDGYENVQRPRVPVNFNKPHDEYGNSMIAFLQSNKDPRGVYITSRWNHGHGESSGTEADHAYTMEEFMKITGVTPEDLQRIYDIWKANAPKRSQSSDKGEAAKAKKELIHKLKYAQMRINGGEDPLNFFIFTQLLSGKIEGGPRKTICVAQPRTAYFGTEWANFFKPQFIIDKGTVLFDTIAWGRDSWPEINPSIQYYNLEDHSGATIFRNCMVIADGAGTIFYDMRKKAPISVDGISRFKYVPKRYAADVEDEDFAMVKMTSNTIALIDMKNNQPLRLPNGEYWFNNLIDARNYNYGRNTDCCFLDKTKAPFLEIIYDMSSGEKYFFNVATRKFVTAPSMEEALGLTSTGYTPCISHNEQLGNDFAILTYEQVNRRGWGESAGEIIVDGNFNKAYIGNFNKFYGLQIKDEVIAFRPFKDQAPSPEQIFLPKPGVADLNRDLVYDTQSDMILKVDGKYLLTGGIKGYGSVCYVLDDYGYKALFVNVPGTNGPGSVKSYCLIYDANRKALLMNPYKYPSSLLFEYHEYSSGFDKEEYETLTKHPWSYSKKNHRCLVVFKDGGFNPNDYHQDYDWNHDYFIDANLRKHLVVLDPETLAPYPLDLENREGLHSSIGVQQEPSPAIQIREEDIKKMVKNAINEIYGKRK